MRSKPSMHCAWTVSASALTSGPISLLLVPPGGAAAWLHPPCGSLHAGDAVLLLAPLRNESGGNYSFLNVRIPPMDQKFPSACTSTAQSAKDAAQKREPPKTLPVLCSHPRDSVKEKFTSSSRGLLEYFLNTKPLA